MSQVQLTTLGEKMTGYSGKELTQMGFEIFGLLPRELIGIVLCGSQELLQRGIREHDSFLRKLEQFDWDIYKRKTKKNKKGDFKLTKKNIARAFEMIGSSTRSYYQIKDSRGGWNVTFTCNNPNRYPREQEVQPWHKGGRTFAPEQAMWMILNPFKIGQKHLDTDYPTGTTPIGALVDLAKPHETPTHRNQKKPKDWGWLVVTDLTNPSRFVRLPDGRGDCDWFQYQ